MSERGDGTDDPVSPDVGASEPATMDDGPAADRSPERRGSADGTQNGSFLGDFLSSLIAVLGIGLLLFAVSGVWPPMVAIESPSMEPNIDTGDLVFVMEEHRFAPAAQTGNTGIVTARTGKDQQVGYQKFHLPGDVIIYRPDGSDRATPVIHRAAFWVEAGENWYPMAEQEHVPDGVEGCPDLKYCPAPHSGFITLGDNNPRYDQIDSPQAVSGPVRPEWVIGTAEFRLPGLGWLRLQANTVAPVGRVDTAALATARGGLVRPAAGLK